MELKRKLAIVVAAGGMLLATATPAFATVVNVGGGTWDYGTGGGRVYSNYYHGRVCHGSSVEGQYFVSSGNVRAGVWARAAAPDRPFVADRAYWRNSCQ